MKHRFRLELDEADGALPRVLLTAARRGGRPVGIVARLAAGRFEVELEVESARPPALLARQLERLFDVRSVEVLP
jgi:acetolactate synthase regulatory subunit